MIVIAATVFGALMGSLVASRRKGKSLDILQYAAGYAILFAMAGLFVTLIVHRTAM
ncbi:MAG: apolipoprotein acyltransferase [Thalassovita sp.]